MTSKIRRSTAVTSRHFAWKKVFIKYRCENFIIVTNKFPEISQPSTNLKVGIKTHKTVK